MRHTILAICLVFVAQSAFADMPNVHAGPSVHLSASASTRVRPDTFIVDFSAVRSGSDVSVLNAQVSKAIADAMREAKDAGVSAHTTDFSTQPTYRNEGGTLRLEGWTVRAGLRVDGNNAVTIANVAAQLGATLHIDRIQGEVSHAERERVLAQLLDQAIVKFRSKATQIAHDFGSNRYMLGNVTVSDEGPPRQQLMQGMALLAIRAEPSVPVPISPGKQDVSVVVSGDVTLAP